MKNYSSSICITGPTCSGKSVAAEYITENYNLELIEHSELNRRVIKEQGLPLIWNSIFNTNIELREKYGKDYIIRTLLAEHGNPKSYVFSGVRTIDELGLLEMEYGAVPMAIILSMDVNDGINLGYQRMLKRKRIDDPFSYEEFKKGFMREWNDMNPLGFQSCECVAYAEKLGNLIINNSTKEELYKKIDTLLTSI